MKFFVFAAVLALASAGPSSDLGLGPGTLVFGGESTYNLRLPSVDQSLTQASSSRSSSSLSSGYSGSSGYSSGLSASAGLSRSAGLSASAGLGGLGGLGGGAVATGQLYQLVPVQQQSLQLVQLAGAAPIASSASASSYASSARSSGPITAAVQSRRTVEFVDVASTRDQAQPQSIVIGPSVNPLEFEFQSQSSPISVRQSHIPGQAAEPQFSSHQEEPDLLRQEIVKPIVHEVTEAIQPVRKITQEVRPVQETITQLISRGEQQQVQRAGAAQSVQSAQSVRTAQSSQLGGQAVQTLQLIPVQIQSVASAPVQTVPSGQVITLQVLEGLSGGLQSLNGLQGSQGIQSLGGVQALQGIRKRK